MKTFLLIAALLISHGATAQVWNQIGSDIDGEAVDNRSGTAVSMPDAHTVAIGAIGSSSNASWAGRVRVYSWNDSAWVQKGADIDGTAADNQLGSSVSMPDANTVAMGAPGYYNSAGYVRVYAWNDSTWVQKGADINGETVDDWSGYSVSMPDANTVAIGGIQYWSHGPGQVRVFEWSGSAWVQKGADINGEGYDDASGYSVSMPDTNTLAIGASGGSYVRVYTWSGSDWIQKGADIDGYSVSMPDAITVATGGDNGDHSGLVRVRVWTGSAWMQKGADIDGEAAGDYSGTSISMPDTNTVAIGAPGNSGNGYTAGQVRVYLWSGSAWVQQGAEIDGEAAMDWSGASVSMPDANTMAIGAPYANTYGVSDGPVRVFGFSGVGIHENQASELAAYPNPTTGTLTLELGQLHKSVLVTVENALGQPISTTPMMATSQFMLALDGPTGVYFVAVSAGNNVLARVKVMKQ